MIRLDRVGGGGGSVNVLDGSIVRLPVDAVGTENVLWIRAAESDVANRQVTDGQLAGADWAGLGE